MNEFIQSIFILLINFFTDILNETLVIKYTILRYLSIFDEEYK